MQEEVAKIGHAVEEIRSNKVYEDAFEWRFEFPEVLDENGGYLGFDVVIGNPPYIRIQDLRQGSELIVEHYNQAYFSTGSGNYDLYIPFIELGHDLLSNDGDLCYIMPHKFTNAKYGKKIREFIVERNLLRKIVHFGAKQVFEDATTYTALFFMSKIKSDTIQYHSCSNFNVLNEPNNILFERFPSSFLTKEEWSFPSEIESEILNKLRKNGLTLESYTKRIYQGLKTSADKIYILEKISVTGDLIEVFCRQNEQKYTLEKNLLFPLIKGGNSRAFSIEETDLLILFPYEDGSLLKAELISRNYPKTWKYLLDHKNYLESRENGKLAGPGWYAFGRNQALDVIQLPKIFTPDIAPSPRFSFDVSGEFLFTGGVSGGYGITPKSNVSFEILLAILNSPLCAWYISKTSTQMRGGWYSFESRYIKSIPMPSLSDDLSEIESKVKKLISPNVTIQASERRLLIKEINRSLYSIYGLDVHEQMIIEKSLIVAENQ